MVPLDTAAVRKVVTRLGPLAAPGLLALRHALAFRRPGVWADAPSAPRSVILVREAGDRLEAFGAGEPEPAVGWLVGHLKGFTLLAPPPWQAAVRARVGGVDLDAVETWSWSAPGAGSDARPATPAVVTRRLTPVDLDGFVAAAPAWGLRGWGSYPDLIEHGAAFGVPLAAGAGGAAGFASLAWVFDQADCYDAVGVHTAPRFRRLGLGRAAAGALVAHVVGARGRAPLWSTAPGNEASRATARSLGFRPGGTETLVRWPPAPGERGR